MNTEKVREKGQRLAAVAEIERKHAERLVQVDRFLACDKWLERLPGKQLLDGFLSKHTKLTDVAYLATAVSTVIDKRIGIPDIERLKLVLNKIIARTV